MIKNGKNIALSDFETAMGLWKKYGFEYRIILDEYRFYLRIKKELGIKPVNRLSKLELDAFPDIYFLNIPRQVDAEEYLLDLKPYQIKDLIGRINHNYVGNGLIHNLRSRITDYKRQIEHSTISYSRFGCDPNSCSSGSHTRQNKVLAASRFKEA